MHLGIKTPFLEKQTNKKKDHNVSQKEKVVHPLPRAERKRNFRKGNPGSHRVLHFLESSANFLQVVSDCFYPHVGQWDVLPPLLEFPSTLKLTAAPGCLTKTTSVFVHNWLGH
ncbi:hypothetical protein NPIL_1351 [Nephila pilipes]|uniref:Uncharacterized protein n=1 Tax=Nephila pilipes TaxID=299642 RepID=A0A8X6N915_NEPPI|nr:hypothetical protein NPIL_1351 [Nephila pilipes]